LVKIGQKLREEIAFENWPLDGPRAWTMGPQNLKFRILNSFLLKVTDMKFHQDWLSPSKVIQGKRSDGRTDGRPPPSIYGRVRNFFISKFIPSYSLRKFASLTCSARSGKKIIFVRRCVRKNGTFWSNSLNLHKIKNNF
jgi:hypothetical protein